jgi:hypothetical protein
MDPLHLLAQVNHLVSQDASSKLETVAQQQKDKVYEKRQVRAVQEAYDKAMSDETVDPNELANLKQMMGEIGVQDVDGLFSGLSGTVQTGNAEDATQRTNKTKMEAIERAIDGKMDGLEDNEALLQFEIQMATSEMTNADANRGQAEKRLSDHRNEMRRNWAP